MIDGRLVASIQHGPHGRWLWACCVSAALLACPTLQAAGHPHSHPGVQRDTHGRIVRSVKARDSFKHTHPCPANGKPSGRCRGYVIDHVVPLKRGGADSPANMQWQTTAEAKAKDRTE